MSPVGKNSKAQHDRYISKKPAPTKKAKSSCRMDRGDLFNSIDDLEFETTEDLKQFSKEKTKTRSKVKS